MKSFSDIRKKYPQYDDMSDQEFADKFHDKFYSDIPKDQFYQKIQFFPKKQLQIEEKTPESLLQKAGRYAEQYVNKPVESSGLPNVAGGFLQGTANVLPGLYNLGAKAANLLPGVNVEEKKGFHFAPEGLGSTLGEIGSFFTPAMLSKLTSIPKHLSDIPMIANAVKKASDIVGKSPLAIQKVLKTGKSIGKNALTGAVLSPESQGLGAALGAGGAALGSGLGYAVPKVANKLGIGVKPGRETIEGLSYEDVAPSVEAAERLGTPLRPSEATRNPFIAGLEGKYHRTREASFKNVESGLERKESEKEAINKLLGTIYDKSTASDNKVRNLYEKAYKWNIKPEIINNLKSDPIIDEAFNAVKNDSAWQRKLKNTNENNYAYLDKVRKSISDQESKLIKSGEKSRAAEYTDARRSLVDIMDKASPVYAKARAEAQKSIVRSQIEKKIANFELKGSDFYKKIIKNESKFNDLLNSLKNVPEAQSQLKDMKEAWHSLINVEKPSTASYQSEKAINQARGSLQKAMEMWNQLTGKKKNLEAVKYIRSNDWVEDLKKAKQSGNKKEVENVVSDIMGKLIPGSFASNSEGNK